MTTTIEARREAATGQRTPRTPAASTTLDPLEIFSVAWEGVVRNKARSLLTMLGVIIGVAAVIVMIAISAGTEATIAEQIEGLGTNLIFIQASFGRPGPGGFDNNTPRLLYEDLALVESVQGVTGTAVDRFTSATVKRGTTTLSDVPLLGTSAGFPSVRDLEIATGRYFNNTEVERSAKVAVLGASLARNLFGAADPIGQTITAGTTQLTVIGVAAERGVVGNTDFDAQLYTPITLVFKKFLPTQFAVFAGNELRLIYVQVAPDADMDRVITQLQARLAAAKGVRVAELPFTFQTQQDIIEAQGSTTAAFRNLLAWVAGVSLLVGGIGIMNIMLVSVTERTREIGIRQAVGAAPNDIRLQFLAEALMLSLVGGLVGALSGVAGALLFGTMGDMRTVIVPGSILLAFGSAAAVGIFFGFYPANKAAQLDPIEALRHE
ncbi:MAG: ABC transporter permease [Ardenticatenaceae bacterium]|nr:ABC transporter permease [Ardenticatenaceae bacterium]HBY99067.1 hypothetical protein [Chloroflexota bacterium]